MQRGRHINNASFDRLCSDVASSYVRLLITFLWVKFAKEKKVAACFSLDAPGFS